MQENQKTAVDIIKMMCLGADRVGFGTLAMVAIGCTICRGCQLDTCHVGIATQIESATEATERGLKKFEPQELEIAVQQLIRFFSAMRDELSRLAGHLGVARTDNLFFCRIAAILENIIVSIVFFHRQLPNVGSPRPMINKEPASKLLSPCGSVPIYVLYR